MVTGTNKILRILRKNYCRNEETQEKWTCINAFFLNPEQSRRMVQHMNKKITLRIVIIPIYDLQC